MTDTQKRLDKIATDVNNYFDNDMFEGYDISVSYKQFDWMDDAVVFYMDIKGVRDLLHLLLSRSDQDIKNQIATSIFEVLDEHCFFLKDKIALLKVQLKKFADNKAIDLHKSPKVTSGCTLSTIYWQSLPLPIQGKITHNQIVLSDYTHLLGLSGLTDKDIQTALSRATIKGIDYHTAILELTFRLQYGGNINSFHSIVKPKQKKKEPVLITGNKQTESEPDYRDLFHELEQRYREYDNPIRP